MKNCFLALMVSLLVCTGGANAQSIAQVTTQLVLDIQKLAELKDILQDMYKGYQILDKGYTDVKNIVQGNFNLHQAFLDGLFLVSPAVRNYPRVTDIINAEYSIVSQYKSALSNFQANGHFSVQELAYISNVYSNMFNQSLNNLNELVMVITAGQLRMSDDERLGSIDRIYLDITGTLRSLGTFNRNTTILALNRAKEAGDINGIQNLYGIQN